MCVSGGVAGRHCACVQLIFGKYALDTIQILLQVSGWFRPTQKFRFVLKSGERQGKSIWCFVNMKKSLPPTPLHHIHTHTHTREADPSLQCLSCFLSSTSLGQGQGKPESQEEEPPPLRTNPCKAPTLQPQLSFQRRLGSNSLSKHHRVCVLRLVSQ